jgi:hypothetical protein
LLVAVDVEDVEPISAPAEVATESNMPTTEAGIESLLLLIPLLLLIFLSVREYSYRCNKTREIEKWRLLPSTSGLPAPTPGRILLLPYNGCLLRMRMSMMRNRWKRRRHGNGQQLKSIESPVTSSYFEQSNGC